MCRVDDDEDDDDDDDDVDDDDDDDCHSQRQAIGHTTDVTLTPHAPCLAGHAVGLPRCSVELTRHSSMVRGRIFSHRHHSATMHRNATVPNTGSFSKPKIFAFLVFSARMNKIKKINK